MELLDPRLQAFLSVARSGTVHGAAKSLGLTQTGVTQRIRALERGLGVTLFSRSRKGMRLTAEGEALLQYGSGAEELEGLVLSRLRGSGEAEAHFTIAGPTSAVSTRLPKVCAAVMKEFPAVYLHVVADDLSDRVELVKTNRAQAAIVPPALVPREMDSKRLSPDRYLLVGSSKWKGRKLADILASERIIDFYESDRTTLEYLARFKLSQQARRPRLYVNDNATLISLFVEGLGFGTLAEPIAEPLLKSGKLIALNQGAVFEDPLALVWYPRPQMPSYLQSFIQLLR
jgi:DNA-binding transcriptional LysR family regulator